VDASQLESAVLNLVINARMRLIAKPFEVADFVGKVREML
jgi:hypothetical protein